MKKVIIVGGGVMGSAIAYFLARQNTQALDICVIERDPSYASASSALSASSIRQQFSQTLNIHMSAFGWQFLQEARQHLSVPGQTLDLQLHQSAYLYLADSQGAASLRAKHALQTAAGAQVSLLNTTQLAQRYPWLATQDIALGSLGLAGEGWFDGYALLMAFRAKARSLGVRYLPADVKAWSHGAGRVHGVELTDGQILPADLFVNAAGAWSAKIGDASGLRLPVAAKRRTVFVVSSPAQTPGCPLLIDPSGLWCRPEGQYWLCGLPPIEDKDDLELQPDYQQWQSVWEILAQRIPAMAALRMQRAWAGYYEMNTLDQNGIVGLHPEWANLWLACDFSGHGLQHAPAVGRASAEFLTQGAFQSLDLTPLSPQRIVTRQAFLEDNVI